MIGTYKIDSTKIRLPFDDCEILNEGILSHYVLVNELTGEVSNTDFKRNCWIGEANGVKCRIAIESVNSTVSAKGEPPRLGRYITLVITSKMLGTDYFKGITKETLPIVYDYVMGLEVFKCSYDVWQNAMVTDTDICKDFKASFDEMRQLFQLMERSSIPYSKRGVGVKTYIKGESQNGIEWNDRNTTSQKHPFVKVYSKQLDFYGEGIRQDRKEFAATYINQADCNDIYRVESTVKNRKSFKAYEVTDTRLCSIVDLSQEKMAEIVSKSLKKNTIRPTRTQTKTKKSDMTPQERTIYNSLSMILHSTPYSIAVQLITEDLPPSSRVQYTKKYDAVYNKWIKGREPYKAEEMERLMETVGWVI
jgi:hypothetical protein